MTTSPLTSVVTAVDHVGIAVPDLDAAITWYADTLGLLATHTETNEEQGVREAMLSAPGDTGAAVQLLAPLRPDSPIGRFLDRNGPGIQQVAYRVADIDAACATLRDKIDWPDGADRPPRQASKAPPPIWRPVRSRHNRRSWPPVRRSAVW